jgi:hypothetical protein
MNVYSLSGTLSATIVVIVFLIEIGLASFVFWVFRG